jgi:hypothetical protein
VLIWLQGVIFCISLLSGANETLQSLRKVASSVLVSLCDPKHSIDSAIALENDKAVVEILVCLYPAKSSVEITLPGERASPVAATMMSFIVEQCQPWPRNNVTTALRLHQARILLYALHGALTRSRRSAEIVDFIELGGVPEWWEFGFTFSSSPWTSEAANCAEEQTCSYSLDRLRSGIASDFSSLLLTAAWNADRAVQNPETCERLLNRLRSTTSREHHLFCSYNNNDIMGLTQLNPTPKRPTEADKLRAELEKETQRRNDLEVLLTQYEKLVGEERQANDALKRYVATVERASEQKSRALEDERQNYRELMADADRRVQTVVWRENEEQILLKAKHFAREGKLESEIDDLEMTLEKKEEELQHERQDREKILAEEEAASEKAKKDVGAYICWRFETANP